MNNLKRPLQPMPDDVLEALRSRGLMEAYRARPPYQQNDYLGWLARAVRRETRQRRLGVMLRELSQRSGYMGLPYTPKA
jgi:hypothetical protein